MKKDVYFSFHYKDVQDFRANVVRKSGVFRKKGSAFRDASINEEVKEDKVNVIKALIDTEIKSPNVTCVLIGDETFARRWVRYELVKSFEFKKGLVGVGINWIKGRDGNTKLLRGENPFSYLGLKISEDGKIIEFFEKKNGSWILFRDLPNIKNSHFNQSFSGKDFRFSDFYNRYSYDWHNGSENFSKWIDESLKNVVKLK